MAWLSFCWCLRDLDLGREPRHPTPRCSLHKTIARNVLAAADTCTLNQQRSNLTILIVTSIHEQ
ncbi:unnamed protein product [Musa hybrid cultivar]